jgi:hypothetical protein
MEKGGLDRHDGRGDSLGNPFVGLVLPFQSFDVWAIQPFPLSQRKLRKQVLALVKQGR